MFENRLRCCQLLLFSTLLVTSSVVAQDEFPPSLLGEWKADSKKTRALLEQEGIEDLDAAVRVSTRFQIRFREDGRFRMVIASPGMPNVIAGKWKVTPIAGEEDHYELELHPNRNQNANPMTGKVSVVDKDHIKIVPDGRPPAVYSRMVDEMVVGNHPDDLIGKWEGHVDRTREVLEQEELDDEKLNGILEQVKTMSVEFRKDGAFFVSMGPDEKIEGMWRAVSEDDKAFTGGIKSINVKTRTDEDSGTQRVSFRIDVVDSDTIIMRPVNQLPAAFRRAESP